MDKRNLRNLTADEIVGQLVLAKRDLSDFDSLGGPRPDGQRVINNIVFMGMGEPLLNYRQVLYGLTSLHECAG
jgi:23S rRNA (adenine2503-C2)-methyltransferase